MAWTYLSVLCLCAVVRTQVIPGKARTNDGDYNTVNTDGSFDFGYANKDRGSSYHLAHGNTAGVVGGRFGAKDPATDTIKETVYTAGPRGFRAKGPLIHRKMDLDQRPRGPIGNKDDPYFDPNEDPSYAFKFDTRTYSKNENADSRGDVKGHYSFVDDVGERHEVSYVAGRDTGFHVSSAHPDSPNLIGAPFHRAPLVRAEKRPRGRTAVQRGLDGSYRFISAGPDQRRTESSDSHGNVRGSYTFLDDKGVQRTVHYIAGPGIGYRIVKSGKDPYIPTYFPTIPSAYDPDFVSAGSTGFSPDDSGTDDIFKGPDGTAASGHVKPPPFPTDKDRPGKKPTSATPVSSEDTGSDESSYNPGPFGSSTGGSSGVGPSFGSGSGGPSFGSGSGAPSFGGGSGVPSFGSGSGSPSFGSGSGSPGFGSGSGGPGFGSGSGSPSFGSGAGGPGFGSGSGSPSLGSGSGGPGFGSGSGGPTFGSGAAGPSLGSGPGGPSFGSDSKGPGFGESSEDASFGKGPGGSSGSNFGQGSGSSGPGFGQGTSGSSFGQGSGETSFGQSSGGPNLGPISGGSSYGGSVSSSFEQDSKGPSFPGTGDDSNYTGDEEVTAFGGTKPAKGSGKPGRRPTTKPVRPPERPYVPLKPFQNNKDEEFEANKDDNNIPQFAIGFNIVQKPGITTIYRPGTTIIRNIGQDYFGVPPGVSVRAHVQSIDLYPYDSKPLTPAEAMQKDKT